MRDLINNKTDEELLKSLLAEIAKARNEVNCAVSDLQKASGRLSFLVMLANGLIDRTKDLRK
jgi:glutamine phosphoribosylpyrophosphate amidotransferase